MTAKYEIGEVVYVESEIMTAVLTPNGHSEVTSEFDSAGMILDVTVYNDNSIIYEVLLENELPHNGGYHTEVDEEEITRSFNFNVIHSVEALEVM